MIFHLTDQNLLQNFVINLFKTLTGRKLVTKYLSSECLTKGETLAILALFGNIPLLKYYQLQWLMVDLRLLHIVLLVLLESYLYLWTSYHQCFLKVVLHHEQKLLEVGCFQQWDFFSMSFSFIALILSWLANDLEITSSALLLSSISFHKSVLRYSCSGHWKFL